RVPLHYLLPAPCQSENRTGRVRTHPAAARGNHERPSRNPVHTPPRASNDVSHFLHAATSRESPPKLFRGPRMLSYLRSSEPRAEKPASDLPQEESGRKRSDEQLRSRRCSAPRLQIQR